jgi:hypothetical protein
MKHKAPFQEMAMDQDSHKTDSKNGTQRHLLPYRHLHPPYHMIWQRNNRKVGNYTYYPRRRHRCTLIIASVTLAISWQNSIPICVQRPTAQEQNKLKRDPIDGNKSDRSVDDIQVRILHGSRRDTPVEKQDGDFGQASARNEEELSNPARFAAGNEGGNGDIPNVQIPAIFVHS